MFKRLLIIIGVAALVMVFLFVLMNQGAAPTNNDINPEDLGSLRVAVHGELPNMGLREFNDQEPVGYEIDLAKKLAEKTYGDEKLIDMKTSSMRTALVMLNSKRVDCVIATQIKVPKSADYAFSQGYFTDQVNVLFKNGEFSNVSDFGNDKKIGVISGSAAANMLEEKKKELKAGFTIVKLESYPDAKEWLDSGKIDAFCGAQVFLQNMAEFKRFQIGSLEYVIVTRKADTKITEKLEAALSELNSQGITKQLQEKWNFK